MFGPRRGYGTFLACPKLFELPVGNVFEFCRATRAAGSIRFPPSRAIDSGSLPAVRDPRLREHPVDEIEPSSLPKSLFSVRPSRPVGSTVEQAPIIVPVSVRSTRDAGEHRFHTAAPDPSAIDRKARNIRSLCNQTRRSGRPGRRARTEAPRGGRSPCTQRDWGPIGGPGRAHGDGTFSTQKKGSNGPISDRLRAHAATFRGLRDRCGRAGPRKGRSPS